MDPKITLITGTSKGIGRFLAEHYLKKGHQVIGCSRKEPEWELEGYHHLLADVSEENSILELFRFVRQKFGLLHNTINNAGIAAMNHSLLTPMSTIENVLQTNVAGTFLICRESAKLMKKNKQGRIVNFSSVAVPLKVEGEAIYAASKAAVISLTEVLAKEFAPFGVTVNAIGPSPIETDLIRGVPKDKIDELVQKQAIKRLGKFEDVSNVVDFFLQDESSYISGQSIFLGGV